MDFKCERKPAFRRSVPYFRRHRSAVLDLESKLFLVHTYLRVPTHSLTPKPADIVKG